MLEMSMCGYTRVRPKADLRKWQVGYRTNDGGYGVCGWVCLFNRKKDAEEWGKKFMESHSYVAEIIVQHPSPSYSAY